MVGVWLTPIEVAVPESRSGHRPNRHPVSRNVRRGLTRRSGRGGCALHLRRVRRTAAHHSVNDLKRTVTPGHGGHRAGECFQRCRVWQWACQNVGIGMNVNNHPTSANLGVFVVLGIVPIMVYVVVILVLPWVGRGFH